MLAGCLCCALMPAFAKDAGWQWYNEKLKPRMRKSRRTSGTTAANGYSGETRHLQQATKKSLRSHSVSIV
jgi:hypothetical protein